MMSAHFFGSFWFQFSGLMILAYEQMDFKPAFHIEIYDS